MKKKKIENPAKYELFPFLMTFVTPCGAERVKKVHNIKRGYFNLYNSLFIISQLIHMSTSTSMHEDLTSPFTKLDVK